CQKSHHHGSAAPELPTRVLDIGDPKKFPVLVESRGATGRYCVLSYCWGKCVNSMTIKSNVASHLQGIEMGTLPQTIQDAIEAARSLDFQYIWIDSLCIIQDDKDDWEYETSRMHVVYANADLTISSLTARDCTNSFFQPRKFRGEIALLAAYHPDRRYKGDQIVRGPVHRRGWTLQEHLLSTRILYFGPGFLHWDCLCEYATEHDPYPFDVQCKVHDQRRLERDQNESLRVWRDQVAEFTQRALSNASDRGPAFMAVSTYMARKLGNEYIGGIWKGDKLFESLCWNFRKPMLSSRKGPSWTWTQVDGEIAFDILNSHSRGSMVQLQTNSGLD
ncbi:heterokaryon incompatibility protein-domain-containing protein, partial [Leptodontidium sp. 2 PMI_412]